MTGRDFWDLIDSDPKIELHESVGTETQGVDEDYLVVSRQNSDDEQIRTWFVVKFAGIKEATRRDMEGVFRGERPPRVMSHLARIVGYYAFVHNFNPSKVAELRDRHRGKYAIPETA